MKFLIVGLGNIGIEYQWTRHNIGFEIADYLAKEKGISFSMERLAYKAEYTHKSRKIVLIKPTTYMNLSGKAVRYYMEAEKIPLENVLILTDDIALPFGKLRLRPKGSGGGHNGLGNIEQVLQTNNYARLRIGIGGDFAKGQQVNYVLGKWTEAEAKEMPFIIPAAAEIVHSFCAIGLQFTMNQFNK